MRITATSAVLCVAVLVSTTIQGNWRQDGVDVPDTPGSKSDGGFGAQLILTDKPDEFFANWEKEGRYFFHSETDKAVRGKPIVAVVLFTGCAPDKHGLCNAEVRHAAYAPNGKSWGKEHDGELWAHKPPPPDGEIQLSMGNMGIVIDPDDALGTCRVRAEIRDKVSKKRMVLERTFDAIEADGPAVPAKTGKPSCKLEENCDCSVPGSTIRWKAASCMLHEETDDLENVAVQECLARRDPDEVRKLPACEQNMHWKTMICRAAHDAKEVRDCVDDERFIPRFVEEGPGW